MGGSQGRYVRVWKISPPPGFDPRTFQPVASRYTDRVIPAHIHICSNLKSHINSDLSITFCRQEIPVSLHNSRSYTGRFTMFSVITNICNKKIKGPTLMELFAGTGKLKRYFLTTTDVRYMHHGWHGTHRYDIKVLATHASTWVLSACTDTQYQ